MLNSVVVTGQHVLNWCIAGHAGVIQQLYRRGFHLAEFDDVDNVENLLMVSDPLHHVSTMLV